ncbi:MAG: putative nucleotidyltransferase [Acidimicrobiales bacterium]|nr:putative nucleotidyltransferase [Acidimicrobiales bacterium]
MNEDAMDPPDEDLTPDARATQEALDRSRRAGRRILEDPVRRAALERRIEELKDKPADTRLSCEEFLAQTAWMVRRLPDTPMGRRLLQRREAVIEVARRRGATNVRVFGSVARGDDTDDSDVDLLVDLAPDVSLVGLAALARELGELLGRVVDVVPASGLKPGLASEVLDQAVAL